VPADQTLRAHDLPLDYKCDCDCECECACRILGSLALLKELHLPHEAGALEGACGAMQARPTLHALRRIHLGSFGSPLRVLARCIHIPASARVHNEDPWVDRKWVQPLYISGWGRGWLPAVLATWRPGAYAVVAADDGDVDHYLASVPAMHPRQQQEGHQAVWLGSEVTPAGFSRLLSCPQQPLLRLEVGTAAQSKWHNRAPQGSARLTPTPAHFDALAGVSAVRLVSLQLAGCKYLTNRDVALLAGACPALKELQLRGALTLTDAALQLLAVGCRRLRQVRLTQARVTEEGVVVALTMLGELWELALGDVPSLALEQLEGRVQREMPAAEYMLWAVNRLGGAEACITWRRLRRA
jgi:hypothetical protein